MKKLFFTFLISASLVSFAQAPQEISYQGVARNASGSLLSNQNIGIKLDLHQGSSGGSIVFSETHSKTTNAFGLFTLGIGSVNPVSFANINWANGPYFLEVSMDPAGGTAYTSVGTQQFMSVPYALYAKTAGNATTYSAGNGISVSGNTISNTAPDQTVFLNAAGSTTVTGTYPSFTINTPTTQVYSAGNGIDITGSVISNTATAVTPTIVGTGATTVTGVYPNLTINTPTVAPDQAVSLTGAGTATVTGAYPNFTVNVPSGTSLPNAYSGQFLFNNGTIWDTLPRTNLYFDGTNFGVGTKSPQANFHVVGAGRFDASVSTPQIYANAMNLAVGTYTNAGDVLTNDGAGNATWQAIPSPTLSYNNGTNVLTLTQGSVVTTATLVGTGSNTVSMVGSGLATVTPTTGSTFTVSVPSPTFTNAGPTTITGAYPNYTVSSTSTPSTTLVQGNNVSLNNSGNTYTISAVTPTITGTGATTVTGTYPNLTINTPTAAVAATPTITGSGNAVVTPTTGNVFTVNVPTQTLTVTSNSVITSNLGGTATITPAVLSYTPGTNTLKLTDGLSVNTVTLNSTSSTSLTPGANVTVVGSAPNYTVSAPAYSISIPGGNVVQITNGVSTSTSAINATNLTLTGTNNNILSAGGNTVALNTYTTGTGIIMTGTAPNYTLSSPNQSLSIAGNSLSITGGNTVTIPTSSINGLGTGIATVTTSVNNFTVNVPSPTYTASNGVLSFGGTNTVVVSPTLSLTGSTLTSGAPTNSVNLSSLSVWSNSVGVLYPTTLTNSVGIGTSGPLTDKVEINHASTTANTHLHLKQTGADAFSRMKFTNAVAPSKFWLSTVTSAPTDANSGYNFFYNNGTIGQNIFTIAGDGLVSVNPFGTMNNARLYVGGKAKIDSSLTMAAYFTQPTLSPLNEGRIYFDRPSQRFKVSENGGAYVNLIGGGLSPWLQGPGVITQNNLGDNVGIGTAAPSSPLHVYGMADPLQITVENTGGNFRTGYHIKTQLSEWFMGQDGSSSTGFRITDKFVNAVRFQIDQMGRVGIGTIFASEKLDVSGNIKLDSSLLVTGLTSVPPTSFGGNGRIYFDQPSGKFKVSENGGAYVDMIGGGGLSPWIQGAGVITQNSITDKVGIGTNTPAYNLDVNGNARFTAGIESNGQVYIANSGNYQSFAVSENGGLGAGINLQATGAGGRSYTMYSENGSGLFQIFDETASTPRMVINSTGNIGIGTIAPSAKFHVNGSTRLVDGTQGPGKVLTSDAAGNASWQAPSAGSGWNLGGNALTGTEFLGSTNTQDVVFKSAGTELMRLKISNMITFTAGQYSMTASTAVNPALTITGANFQSTQLNLKTTAAVTGTGNLGSLSFSDGTNSTTQAFIQGIRDAAGGTVGDLPTALLFYTTPDGSGTEAERMRISNSGRVGVGTTAPSAMLHAVNVTATGSSGRFENNLSTNTADAVFVTNSGSGAAIHAVSVATSTVGLWLENGHIKATASSIPAVSVPTNSLGGFSATPTITPSSNDVKGTVTISSNLTGVAAGNYVDINVAFNKLYSSGPTVMITPVEPGKFTYVVISQTNSNFVVRIINNTSVATAFAAGFSYFRFNYFVIE